MVQLSLQAIQDFKKLVKVKRGIDLTDDEAETMALGWLQFFKIVYKPIKENEYEDKYLRKMD